jgi:hypothetical protein
MNILVTELKGLVIKAQRNIWTVIWVLDTNVSDLPTGVSTITEVGD